MVEVAVVSFDDAGLKSWRYPDEIVISDNFDVVVRMKSKQLLVLDVD